MASVFIGPGIAAAFFTDQLPLVLCLGQIPAVALGFAKQFREFVDVVRIGSFFGGFGFCGTFLRCYRISHKVPFNIVRRERGAAGKGQGGQQAKQFGTQGSCAHKNTLSMVVS
ncbi:hypothetical protein [Methylocaldum sp.]|uniref:hypothetical protein n=1 Tax=Methylocaldum sp. TaxID=1969727 RepID=UPI002D73E057|nr:hypothetical protein [Methylocaldum sp.]HYE36377.1 hypothetical protein [Methylocaldum sp.]